MKNTSRRNFLKTTAGLTIGFSLLGCRFGNAQSEEQVASNGYAALPGEDQIDAWLQVLEDGTVRVLTGKMELGQGLQVVMQQVAGEELNIPPHQVQVILADTALTQNEGYTAGSRSVERSAMTVRRAAAAAGAVLIDLAARHWQLPVDQLRLAEGQVKQNDKDETIGFDRLLKGRQISRAIPAEVKLKPKAHYQWVGRPVPHPDLEKIVRGEPVYVQDLRFPGMVHARVVRPPVYGATLRDWPREAGEWPGVLKIVENGSFLGVIAAEETDAVQARQRLLGLTGWQNLNKLPQVTSWAEFMKEQRTPARGPSTAGQAVTVTHQATYSKPYIMHGSIGPSCAVGYYQDGRLQLWSHTQGVYPLRSTISDMTGLAEDQIRISGVRGSGCYGHNGADDVAADTALLAMAFPGRHVRLQWQRQDEHGWEPYGSAMRMELAASLDAEGKIQKWHYQLWSDGHSTRPRGHAGNLLAARYINNGKALQQSARVGGGTRNAEPYYDIPGFTMQDYHVNGPLRVSALRSLGAYANIFAIESFMSELADKAGLDPIEFRINHLSDERAVAVLRRLRTMIKGEKTGAGEGIGVGFSRYKNTAAYCAVAARVQVDLPAKAVRALKMWAVVEAGEIINPEGVINQTEGGMIQTVSWTLKEEVKFSAESITSRDWGSYPILRFDAVPETEVQLIRRPEQPALGAGEAAQGPAAAALVNAIYRACGKRVRDLPVEKYL